MQAQPKNKILLLIIGMLLLTNMILLGFLFYGKNNPEKKDWPNRQEKVIDYLKNEVGFTAQQLKQYEILSNKHQTEIRQLFDSMPSKRKLALQALSAASFSDTAIIETAATINALQQTSSVKMIQHLKEIRKLCTDEQQARFDTGFYKIVGKRSGKTNKK